MRGNRLIFLLQVAGSWDLSELHVQSSAIAGTGEEASDLVSTGKLVKKVIKTVEEALLNSSPQVPMSQEEGHEVEKCFDAWKVQMDKLKEVGMAHDSTLNMYVWQTMTCTMTHMLTLFPNHIFCRLYRNWLR